MFRTYEQWLADKGVSKEQYATKDAAEMAALQKDYLQYVSTEMQKAEKAPTLEQVIEGLKEDKDFQTGMTKTEKENFETRLEEAEQKAAQAIEGLQGGEAEKVTLAKAIEANKTEIKNLVSGITSKEVVLKADTLRSSIATNISGYVLPDIGQLGVKKPGLYDVLPKVGLPKGNHGGIIKYVDWDEATIARAAAAVAEGSAFPESEAKFKGYTKELVKIGDTLPVSEEFGEDEVTAAAELEMFLDTNVKSKRDAELVNGPGTAGNIEGLVAAAPAYVPVAFGIVAPNIYDLVKKVKTSITTDRGSKYAPDMVVMNDNTADDLHLTKDANENYIFPDTDSIGSMIIVIDNNMADNVLVVGDRRFARIYELAGVVLSRGLKGDQFVEDMETLKARTRLLLLIRNVDKTGFAKVTDIDAALTTLGS